MASVKGTIGTDQVELENAATEDTLRRLLEATIAVGQKNKAELKNIAERAGFVTDKAQKATDEQAEEAKKAAEAIKEETRRRLKLIEASKDFIKNYFDASVKFSNGTANASDLSAKLGELKNGFGIFFTVIAETLKYQENSLTQYQKLTSAGANFGGSLSDMRIAAANSYVTLDKFAEIIQSNSETLARMGGTVNDGAKAFSLLSNNLIKGEIGSNLLALGYTTDDLNKNILQYISITGGRTREELKNVSNITQSTSEYLTQLDALTKITGVSKDKIRDEEQKVSLNAAYQRKLSTLGEQERLKIQANVDAAIASGQKGAVQRIQELVLGYGPLTEETKLLYAVMGPANRALEDNVKLALNQNSTLKDVTAGVGNFYQGIQESVDAMSTLTDVSSLMGGKIAETLSTGQAITNKMREQGGASVKEWAKKQAEVAEEQKKQQESEAKDAADTSKAMKDLAQNITNVLAPTMRIFNTVINPLIGWFVKVDRFFGGAISSMGLLLLSLKLFRDNLDKATRSMAFNSAVNSATSGGGGGGVGPGGGGGWATGGKLAGLTKVRGVGPLIGRGAETLAKFGPKAVGVGAVVGGLVGAGLEYGGDKLTEAGYKKTGATASILGSTAEYASTGAGLGMFLGPEGALIGGALGATIGLTKGLVEHWNAFDEDVKKSVPENNRVSKAATEATAKSHALMKEQTNQIRGMREDINIQGKLNEQTAMHISNISDNTNRTAKAIKQSSAFVYG